MKRRLIYNFNEHGLYYKPLLELQDIRDKIVFVMDTLQLELDYKNGQILSIFGFLPLIKALRETIQIPTFTVEKFHLNFNIPHYDKAVAYDYFNFFPKSKDNFILDGMLNVTYDDRNGRILIGCIQNVANFIKTNDNIICGCQLSGELNCLIIVPDEIIK